MSSELNHKSKAGSQLRKREGWGGGGGGGGGDGER